MCGPVREGARRSRHEADVVRAGGHVVPLVYDTYGTMGEGAEAWFRGLVAVAPIEPPEWMAASGASSEDIADWEILGEACTGTACCGLEEEVEHYPSEG